MCPTTDTAKFIILVTLTVVQLLAGVARAQRFDGADRRRPFDPTPPLRRESRWLSTAGAGAGYALASHRRLVVSTRETTSCEERSTSGLICQSCDLMATCVRVDGAWMTEPVETCDTDAGFYCNVARRGCSNETGPCHPFGYVGNFACTSQGVFPDPYDCQKYHMCYNVIAQPVPANIECGGNKAFSAATGDCSMSLNDTVCSRPQYECRATGDMGAWPGNANIFYICKATLERGRRILYPQLYRCGSAEVFNGRDCMPRRWLETVTAAPVAPVTAAPVRFACAANGLHADPTDCAAYYYCDVLLRSKRYVCPPTTHFNDERKSCMRGKCASMLAAATATATATQS